MTIKPVQKQSSAGQRTRFKAYVAVGDFDGHIGLGKSRIRCRNQKRLKRRRRALIVRFLTVRFHAECSSEVATAIRGALIMAKMHLVPIRRGYWGKNSGLPHTIPMKLSGTCGSVSVRLIPAPRGTGLVAAPASKKILAMAGLEDCYSTTRGHSRTTGNFITAVFNAVSASYGYLSPELWKPTVFSKAPFQEHTDFLAKEAESAKADAAY